MLHSRILPFPRLQGGSLREAARFCSVSCLWTSWLCRAEAGCRCGCRQQVGCAGSSSQAAWRRVTRYFAPGFRVTPVVTHFLHPLKYVLDGNGSAEAEAASARAAWEMLTAIFHSIFGTEWAIR